MIGRRHDLEPIASGPSKESERLLSRFTEIGGAVAKQAIRVSIIAAGSLVGYQALMVNSGAHDNMVEMARSALNIEQSVHEAPAMGFGPDGDRRGDSPEAYIQAEPSREWQAGAEKISRADEGRWVEPVAEPVPEVEGPR